MWVCEWVSVWVCEWLSESVSVILLFESLLLHYFSIRITRPYWKIKILEILSEIFDILSNMTDFLSKMIEFLSEIFFRNTYNENVKMGIIEN